MLQLAAPARAGLNRLPLPEGIDDAVRTQLLNEFNLEIGAGLGDLAGKVWRFGLMGHASRLENIDYCLSSLKRVIL